MFYPIKLAISSKGLTKILISTLFILIIMHVIAMQMNFNDHIKELYFPNLEYWHVSIFDLDEEESFGTWYNSALLFLSSTLFYLKHKQIKLNQGMWQKSWLGLSIIFLILSAEEIVGIHELANSLSDISWTVYFLPIVLLTGIIYSRFFIKNRWRTSLLILLPILMYLGASMGVEFFTSDEVNSLSYNMGTAAEEGLEMLSIIFLCHNLMILLSKERTLYLEIKDAKD